MDATVTLKPYDALYFSCVGQSVSFREAWQVYIFVDRIGFVSQCDDPALEPDRLKIAAAIQRGIYTGHILVSETGNISLAPELESRFEALQVENYNEFEASEKVEEFLLSRPWPIVSDYKLRP